MADAAVVLQQVTTFLLPTINLIDQLLQAFQVSILLYSKFNDEGIVDMD
jgi:hypothetical protein